MPHSFPGPSLSQPRRLPHVLILVDAFPVLSETFIVDHVAGIAKSGFEVTVMARKLKRGALSVVAEIGDNVHVAVVPSLSSKSLLRTLKILLRSPRRLFNPFSLRCALHAGRLQLASSTRKPWDVVHAHFGNNGVIALLANPDWRERLLVNFHGHDITAAPKMYGWGEYRRTLADTRVIVHSAFARRQLAGNLTADVHHVRLGVDVRRFLAPKRGHVWPRRLSMLLVARLVPEKGVEPALEALSILRNRLPEYDIRLRIVGTGPLEHFVRRTIAARKLTKWVQGPSPTEYTRMPQTYACSDLLLMPSQVGTNGWEETFGRAAIEAMATGLPVIGCRSGGLPDTIADAGVVAEGFDGGALADAVETLINTASPNTWASRSIAQAQRHSLDLMVADYVKATQSIIAGPGAPHVGI